MVIVNARNVPEAYREVLWAMKVHGKNEDSRNGPVLTIQEPFCLTIERPWERVLLDPVRQANPYFHVMEFVWMMSGSNDAQWLARYNKRMMSYTDDNATLNGAYGHRWRKHFAVDQIVWVIEKLRADPTTRRAVIAMYDPDTDTGDSLDIPCNTHIYFRIVNGSLNMTVCNRSNDVIWGMLGANAVHMTFLHEFISRAVKVKQGDYIVMTNNAHIYHDVPNFDQVDCPPDIVDYHYETVIKPLLNPWETYQSFLRDAERFVEFSSVETEWFKTVALPMKMAYQARLEKDRVYEDRMLALVKSLDWKEACVQWRKWRE
jgi:hypothetical protein